MKEKLGVGETIVSGAFLTFIFLLGLAVIIGAVVLEAFVVTQLWEMFVVTQFGLKPLSLAIAFGLITLVSLVIRQPKFSKPANEKSIFWLGLLGMYVTPLMVWGVCYLVYVNFVL